MNSNPSNPDLNFAHRFCDHCTTALIYFAVIFGPWAFSSYDDWAIETLNATGFMLGALLFLKWILRWRNGQRPARWGDGNFRIGNRLIVGTLGVLTGALLLYTLTSAINRRAALHGLGFDYYEAIAWLPQSYDSPQTWWTLWRYVGLAGFFWALRDWLLTKADSELATTPDNSRRPLLLPERLRQLLWLLTLNGAAMGVEGIFQRLEGTGRLLFFFRPPADPGAEAQFGPFYYHGNAAQYFNLLWPVCLGFWWTLQRATNHGAYAGGRLGRGSHHIILGCVIVMAACPSISLSRAGAAVTGACLLGALLILLGAERRGSWGAKFRLTVVILFVVGLSAFFVADSLGVRMKSLGKDFQGRQQIYELGWPMSRDYTLFGSGPGTLTTVFQLYRKSVYDNWFSELHNDWLETLITFGRVGSSLLGLTLLTTLARWFAPGGGIYGNRFFVLLIWLGLAGCLAHARFDFPFQIHSILMLFLLQCAVLSCLTRRP